MGMLEQSSQSEHLQLAETSASGVRLGRFGVTVDADRQIGALATYGIEPYPIVIRDYGAFAARYGVGGSFWTATSDPVHIYEIGNEPNIATQPGVYAAEFAQAQSEILAHDPAATVVVGGLAAIYPGDHFDVYDWIRKMVTALTYCPAAVGYHAYPNSLAELQTGLRRFRAALDAVGCNGTGIELNEFYMEGGDPRTLTAALHWLAQADLGVTRIMLFLWCTAAVPSRGLYPAMTLDAKVTSLGRSYLAAFEDPAPNPPTPNAGTSSAPTASATPDPGRPTGIAPVGAGGGITAPAGASGDRSSTHSSAGHPRHHRRTHRKRHLHRKRHPHGSHGHVGARFDGGVSLVPGPRPTSPH